MYGTVINCMTKHIAMCAKDVVIGLYLCMTCTFDIFICNITSATLHSHSERLVFLSQPTNQLEAPVGSVRRLLCHPNLGQVVLWRKNGIDIVFDERVTQFNLGMTINRVDYSDIGRYTCVVDYMGVLQDASANITVQGNRNVYSNTYK